MSTEPGRVLLVGAGPGAADLMTVRAARAVEAAQALLYDALVDESVLGLAPAACVRIQTGKRAGRASMKQETINRLMLRLARRGLRVVRLKGGDPSVFGRSGEERAFLEGHGIDVEIIPGVTAASAAAAQFAFPLTHRGVARRVVFATARVDAGGLTEGGWDVLSDAQTTAVFYMARDSARAVTDRLMAEGRLALTPTLAVENAGRRDARAIAAPLHQLARTVEEADFNGPVLLIVGDAAAQARCTQAPVAEPTANPRYARVRERS
jgi:uroporphyrin-III C-methyltransferase